MESVPPAELSTELKQWLINEAQWVVPVMDYLRRNITTYSAVVALAELEMLRRLPPEQADYEFSNPKGRAALRWEAEKKEAQELLSTGRLHLCSDCAEKVIIFSDGHRISWPIIGAHECEEV